ncbi:ZO28-like protein [Mya arenaria]|uniref:ZO28-like protein n=2 Tax=Mya arenaria TaxID=6604 RepID=A0ABY7DY96_MYAAR|nr:ZO28-like protein [Mya arenaria]
MCYEAPTQTSNHNKTNGEIKAREEARTRDTLTSAGFFRTSLKMEALMSQIMINAAYRVQQKARNLPLDLSNYKLLNHTCDPLVNQEDLRSETLDIASSSPIVRRYAPSVGSDLVSDSSVTESSGYVSGLSDDSVHINRELKKPSPQLLVTHDHPFSIKALLGDTPSISADTPSAPAIITSAFSPAPAFVQHFRQFTRQPKNEPSIRSSKDADTFWCHACNALCVDGRDAQNHQRIHQLQDAPSGLRKSLFSKHGYVTRHIRLNDERFQCSLCDKVVAHCFFTKHQRLHDGYFCEICKKEFSTNSRLRDHMNVHSGSKPFTCSICDRKFSKRSSLTQHYRYHRDHRSFKCGYCAKYFNSKYACAVHERLHTGENPFRCTVPGCENKYPQKIQLKLHMCSHKM